MGEQRRIRTVDDGENIGVTFGDTEQCLPAAEWHAIANRILSLGAPGVERRCGTCAAWCKPDSQMGYRDTGECRINPPSSHGWPKTKPSDWCLGGWRQKPEDPNMTSEIVKDRPGCLGFDFAYIRDYPEAAVKWLRQAHAERLTAPHVFQPVLGDPMAGHLTVMMPSVADSVPCCEDVFQWAGNIEGYDNGEADDTKWRSLIEYQENPAIKAEADEIRLSLPEDHPWVTACREIAASTK